MKHSDTMNENAKALRKNMTSEEKHLWYDFLSKSNLNAKRQKVFYNYILDFYIPCVRIAIEIDGRQHGIPEHKDYDCRRDAFLESRDILVLRYTNDQININFSNVCKDIIKHCEQRKTSTTDTDEI